MKKRGEPLKIKDKIYLYAKSKYQAERLPLTIYIASGFLFGGKERMKTEKRKGVKAIQATTADAFNKEIEELLKVCKNPQIHYITAGLYLGAYVEYEVFEEVPETLREKYEINGDGRECQECPYFIRTKDRRYKWHFCAQKQRRVTECQGACETYYQLLEEMIAETLKEAK